MADSKPDNRPEHEKAEESNANSEHASLKEMKALAKEGVTDELVDVGTRKVSAEARDPTKVQGVGATFGLAPGTPLTVRLASGREVTARVISVHPGTVENKAAGIPAVEPTVDVKADTGNPNTGGDELIYGLPVSSVVSQANLTAGAEK